MRGKCSDCAYNVVDGKHQHQSFVDTLDKSPGFSNKNHKCHCIDNKLWSGVNEENICIGRKEYLEIRK